MIKGLEALEKLKNDECIVEEHYNECYEDIEKELKALEIIIKKLKIDVYHSRHRETGYEMNVIDSDKNDLFTMITQEEYDLLKEVLL